MRQRQRLDTIPEAAGKNGNPMPGPNTPWGLWTAAGREKKNLHVTQGSLLAIIDDIKRYKLDRLIQAMGHQEFERKAWMHEDKYSSAWVTACPKEHNALTGKQFPVVVQTYFGVEQQCLHGMVG